MRFVDEFRDPQAARVLLAEIADLAARQPTRKFMEVCGGHTHAIYRHGIEGLLPENIELVHGPGCPVCVIPMGRIDDAISIASTDGVTMCCFGDMLRVPGGKSSLLDAKAHGADIRVVYSPLDSLALAEREPDRSVVFLAVGFETTAPSTAATLLEARKRGVMNFSVFSNHITIVPPLTAILDSPGLDIDGFVGPGHVSAIIGMRPYQFIATQYQRPIVTAGFEPIDILQALSMLLRQLDESRCEVENQYRRVVSENGNVRALQLLQEAFVVRPEFEWRGLGSIPESALAVHPDLAAWDAELRFTVPGLKVADPKACQCGEVLKGALRPWDCKVFGTACTPETPIGTCMVSSEGACAAYYNYGRYSPSAPTRIPVRST